MKLSRETEYALQGLVFLARQGGDAVVQLASIAAATGIPAPFLSKIFQKLARHGLLRSHRGTLRGYSLGRSADAIVLREILEATEGPDLFSRCAFWHDTCGGERDPCVLHEVLKKSKAVLEEEVGASSLADLARQWVPPAPHRARAAARSKEGNRWKSGRRRERSS